MSSSKEESGTITTIPMKCKISQEENKKSSASKKFGVLYLQSF